MAGWRLSTIGVTRHDTAEVASVDVRSQALSEGPPQNLGSREGHSISCPLANEARTRHLASHRLSGRFAVSNMS